MTSVFSWQNSVILCPASFCTTRPNLPVPPGLLTSYKSCPFHHRGYLLCIVRKQVNMIRRGIFRNKRRDGNVQLSICLSFETKE